MLDAALDTAFIDIFDLVRAAPAGVAAHDRFTATRRRLTRANEDALGLYYDCACDGYRVHIPTFKNNFDRLPMEVVSSVMTYPDAWAFLDAETLLKFNSRYMREFPNFLTSLPKSRREEIMKLLYDDAMKATHAYKRGDEPTLTEVLDRMPALYRETFMTLLPGKPEEKLESRVMRWLMVLA